MRAFRLRTLMIAVLITGLVVGNYIRVARQFGQGHSYGFPPPPWRIAVLSLAGDLIVVGVVGFAFVAIRMFRERAGIRSR